MQTSRFEAEVRQGDGIVAIALRGQIDVHADGELRDAYERATGLGTSAVVLDFRDVDYINSTGIALIVRLLAEARGSGRELRAFGLSRHYREIFDITRLSDFIVLYPDEAAALAGSGDNGASREGSAAGGAQP